MAIPVANLNPVRITVTIPRHLFNLLSERSRQEGRSLSNLAAFLLECAINPNRS